MLPVLLLLLSIPYVLSLDNGLGLTPAMGWNTWNHYGCEISETLIKQSAEALVSSGLAAVGYVYVNLDDCWQVDRNQDGTIIADPEKFPSGIPALAAHAHQLGLKLGLYSDAGQATCQGRPGGMNYEKIDAKTYADWKIDYLKYDNCNDDGVDVKLRYPRMRDALNATGHPILFSMCEWGVEDPATWAPEVGNSWRTTGDISDNWNSMLSNLDQNDKWWNYSGPGAFNDPDMIEIQNGGMTLDEYTSHFSLWSLIKSPLIIGCDVTNLTSDTLAVLTNKEVIAINQDPLGVQGHRVASQSINPSTNQLIDLPTNQAGDLEVWAGPLHNGDVAVILFNRGSAAANITADFKTIGLSTHQPINQSIKAIKATVRDLWALKDLGSFEDSITLPVNTHAVRMLRITPAKSNDQSINQSTKQSIKRSRHARW